MATSNSDSAAQVIGGLEVHLNPVKKNVGIVSDSESLREMGSVIKLDSQITQEVRDDCPTVVYGDHSPKFLGLPGNDLGTLVSSAQEMEVKMQGVTAQSIQEVADRIASMKAKATMKPTIQTQRPNSFLCPDGTSMPVNRNPRWSDSVEDGNRSKLSDLPDSLLVTKVRADLGLSDLGDQISVGDGSDRARGDHSLSPVSADLTQSAQETGGAGHNTRGGFQGRGRGAYNTSRGVQGGRGSYRQEPRSWADVAPASVRSEVTELIELQKQTENLPGDEDGWSKMIAKGKKKMGLTGVVSPTEPSSSSTERKEDLNPVVCVNTAQGADATNVIPEEANAQVTDSEVMEAAVNHITPVVAVLPTEVIEIVEEEMTTKATTQVKAFHSEVMSIAELLHPAARDIRKEVEAKAKGEKILPQLIGKRMVSPHSSRNSSKNKSSGRNGSQKKKKRVC